MDAYGQISGSMETGTFQGLKVACDSLVSPCNSLVQLKCSDQRVDEFEMEAKENKGATNSHG